MIIVTTVASAYGILVPWQYVAAVHKKECDMETDFLIEDHENWLLEKCILAGSKLRLFTLCSSLLLISITGPATEIINTEIRGLSDFDEPACQVKVLSAANDSWNELDEILINMARELTPAEHKLRFRPGQCMVTVKSKSEDYVRDAYFGLDLDEICIPDNESGIIPVNYQNPSPILECLESIPLDVAIIVGPTNETILMNQAILLHYESPFKQLLLAAIMSASVDAVSKPAIVLQDLGLKQIKAALDYYVGRLGRWACGVSRYYNPQKPNELEDTIKKLQDCCSDLAVTTPAPIIETRNFLLLVGPHHENVPVCREVLATRNPILSKLLYGTEYAPTTNEAYLELKDFDPSAVRLVVKAIELCGQDAEKIKVPNDLIDKFECFAEYIIESPSSLGVELESRFDENVGCIDLDFSHQSDTEPWFCYQPARREYIEEPESDEDLSNENVDEFALE